jgi:hypothetical protein
MVPSQTGKTEDMAIISKISVANRQCVIGPGTPIMTSFGRHEIRCSSLGSFESWSKDESSGNVVKGNKTWS